MSGVTQKDHQDLVLRACSNDHDAFSALMIEIEPKLRKTIRQIIGHPEDTDDLVQETMVRAWEKIKSFQGKSHFSTWVCAIGVRLCMDHLRRHKRWRVEAQVVYANECYSNEALQEEVISAVADPSYTYEVREHIAYCFTCVGRSLEPDEQAALICREMLDMKNYEASQALGLSESVYRHRLAAGRQKMIDRYQGLCALVNQQGICHQCHGLREVSPEHRKGPLPPEFFNFEERLDFVRKANIDSGVSQAMHDIFWRKTQLLEEAGTGSTEVLSDCG